MKVLIVEDNRDHQFIIRKKLEEYSDGIAIDTAETVDEAENFIQKNSYESVLLDYRLQGSNYYDNEYGGCEYRCAGCKTGCL